MLGVLAKPPTQVLVTRQAKAGSASFDHGDDLLGNVTDENVRQWSTSS